MVLWVPRCLGSAELRCVGFVPKARSRSISWAGPGWVVVVVVVEVEASLVVGCKGIRCS